MTLHIAYAYDSSILYFYFALNIPRLTGPRVSSFCRILRRQKRAILKAINNEMQFTMIPETMTQILFSQHSRVIEFVGPTFPRHSFLIISSQTKTYNQYTPSHWSCGYRDIIRSPLSGEK